MVTKKKGERRPGRSKVVEEILAAVERKMMDGETKPSVGDYIRLLQLSREMLGETVTSLSVTWIPEPDTPNEG